MVLSTPTKDAARWVMMIRQKKNDKGDHEAFRKQVLFTVRDRERRFLVDTLTLPSQFGKEHQHSALFN